MKWKLGKVTPRLKSKGLDTSDTSSYRPVTVLPTTSKLVERATQHQLLLFMESTGQLNSSNHAYRKFMSMTTMLMEIMDKLYQGAEENKVTLMMAIDLSAAFDCVDPDLLIEKLERYNIGVNARAWVRDYLTSRTQYVVIGTAQSRMKPVKVGVPQGSVVGPLLYAIHTNEMSEAVKDGGCEQEEHQDTQRLFGRQCRKCGVVSAFADDSMYTVSNKLREANQISILRSIDKLKMYFDNNKLAMNLPKTQLTETMIKQKCGK